MPLGSSPAAFLANTTLSSRYAPPDPFATDRLTAAGAQNDMRYQALQAFRQKMEDAARPQWMQQQAANIADHGSIEDPTAFKLRTGRDTAAELSDPSTALGRGAALDHARKLETIHESNVRPTEIAGQTQRDVAGINRQTALDESADKLAGSMYGSDADAEARLEAELANQVIGGQFGRPGVPADVDRDQAVQGFLGALDQFRRRYGRQAAR